MTSAVRPGRPSVFALVLKVAAVAAVAAILIWSVLFVELLRKHLAATAPLTQPTGQLTSPAASRPAPAPAPVTTRTS